MPYGLAFLLLAVLADRSLPRVAFLPWIAAVLLAYGIAIELVQSRLPYRMFSWGDIAANTAGLVSYALLARVLTEPHRVLDPGGRVAITMTSVRSATAALSEERVTLNRIG